MSDKIVPRYAEHDSEWDAYSKETLEQYKRWMLPSIEQGEPPLAHDPVKAPAHYRIGSIECLDFIEAWGLDFLAGNVIKYVVRAPYKGSKVEDLRKARFYLDRLIARAEAK